MVSLYELEMRAYVTHAVLPCKLEKGMPYRKTNFQRGSLPSYSLIKAIGLD